MKKIITVLLFLLYASLQPAFADNALQQEPTSEAYKQWEQENVGREVAEESRYGELWSKTLMLLIIILIILFAGTWYLKRFGGSLGLGKMKDSGKESRIILLEKRVISPKAVIYLLEIDGHKIALSETSSGIQVLQELNSTPTKEMQTSISPSG